MLVVVLAAGFFGWRYYHGRQHAKSGGYTTAKAASGNIQETVSASGNLISVQNVALTFKNQGYVETCNVQLGDMVTAGQVLATEQTSDLQDALDEAEAKLDSDQAAYNKLVSTKPQEIAQVQARCGIMPRTPWTGTNNCWQPGRSPRRPWMPTITAYMSAEYTLVQDESNADVVAAAGHFKE